MLLYFSRSGAQCTTCAHAALASLEEVRSLVLIPRNQRAEKGSRQPVKEVPTPFVDRGARSRRNRRIHLVTILWPATRIEHIALTSVFLSHARTFLPIRRYDCVSANRPPPSGHGRARHNRYRLVCDWHLRRPRGAAFTRDCEAWRPKRCASVFRLGLVRRTGRR